MTSLRMEPVWMTLGESAGIAATIAVERRCSVQQIEYSVLKRVLMTRGVIIERPIVSSRL